MARHVKDSPITTPKLRAKLEQGVHWRGIDKHLHLGYRKGQLGGEWLVRWYLGDGKYRQKPFAAADDLQPADGDLILEFHDAVKMAGALAEHYRHQARIEANGKAITVETAINAYVAKKTAESVARGGKERRDIHNRLKNHVLGDKSLAERPLYTLGLSDFQEWTAGLSLDLKATAKERIATDFKAALNQAAKNPKNRLSAEFRMSLKDGLAIEVDDAPEARDGLALPDDQIRVVLAAAEEIDREENWEGDLYRLIVVLAATGARFSQVAKLRVRDVQPEHSRIMVPVSRKGTGKKQRPFAAMHVTQDVIEALHPVLVARAPNEFLLERWYQKQAPRQNGMNVYVRVDRGPWRSSTGMMDAWKKIVRRAGLEVSADADAIVPYALRHSSIVRHLKRRIPTRVVAALHDTSTGMIEKHYSSSILDTVDEMVAPAALSIARNVPATVTRLPRKRKKTE